MPGIASTTAGDPLRSFLMKKLAARFLLLFIALLASPAGLNASETLGKTPAYFYDLYGAPRRDRNVSTAVFNHPVYPSAGPIKGPFQVRNYDQGKLRIQVTYALPGLQAIHVQYSMTTTWTAEQLSAALAAYGTEWKMVKGGGFPSYESAAGTTAYHMASMVMIYSPALMEQLAAATAAKDTQRKAVPKF